ncbi:MAG: hypothetical protein MK033_05645 [Candidatus Caenarcaniphilales bacterium]|nr:hypothetical protein [Candidatus Caenarcaniphilales bacterium]
MVVNFNNGNGLTGNENFKSVVNINGNVLAQEPDTVAAAKDNKFTDTPDTNFALHVNPIRDQNLENTIGLIKIGSNTVKLIITDLISGKYNESAKVNLGKGLVRGEKLPLDTDAKDNTRIMMRRFAQILKNKVSGVHILATESMRASEDGEEFLQDIISILDEIINEDKVGNQKIKIERVLVEPEREARLTVESLNAEFNGNIPKSGLMIDFGGASCEFCPFEKNNETGKAEVKKIRDQESDDLKAVFKSLGIGAHPLNEKLKDLDNDFAKFEAFVEEELKDVDFMNSKTSNLYLIGGEFRGAAEDVMEEGTSLHSLSEKSINDIQGLVDTRINSLKKVLVLRKILSLAKKIRS